MHDSAKDEAVLDARGWDASGAVELARMIRDGHLSAAACVENCIQRIEQWDPAVNAVVLRRFEEARREAVEADRQRARDPRSLGLLHGVPITVKECFYVQGLPATMGLTHEAPVADKDGPLVERLRRAGAIVLGKTNVPQLMLWHETDNPRYGRTNNPWDERRSPGGSSGGEAAVIAYGGSALGLASDLGGSIRLPAHFCGVHGLKPTSHRLPRTGSRNNLRGFEVIPYQPGPLARSVSDLELALGVLSDRDHDVDPPDVPPLVTEESRRVRLEHLRIGVWPDDGFFSPHPAIRRLVHEAADELSACGVQIVPFEWGDVEAAITTYYALVAADGGADVRRLAAGSRLDPRIRRLLRVARMPGSLRAIVVAALEQRGHARLARLTRMVRARSADEFWQYTQRLTNLVGAFVERMNSLQLDALLTPPHALPAMPHFAPFHLLDAASYAFLPNLTGMPAGVVSLSRVREDEQSQRTAGRDGVDRAACRAEQGCQGLPIGVQLVGRHWREDVVLAVMQALENAFRTREEYPVLPASRK